MIEAVADSLTVEYSKIPGKTFHRKVLVSTISSHTRFSQDPHFQRAGPDGNTTTFLQVVIFSNKVLAGTYDHRLRRIGHPVRSAIHKPQIGRLVVGWVTTS